MAIGIKLAGLKEVLKTFDEHDWKGSFTRGDWEIGNGGYDCWFELRYQGLLVARCVAGELDSNVNFSVYFTDDQKDKVFDKILEVYDHLKVGPGKSTDLPDMFDDLSKVPTETLQEMSKQAFSEYYSLATKPCGDWHPSMEFPELEEATNRLNAINDELERRITENKPSLNEQIKQANNVLNNSKESSQAFQPKKTEMELS